MEQSKGATASDLQQEQALRRLKYLHTTLANLTKTHQRTKTKGSTLKPIQTTVSLPSDDLKEGDNEDFNQRLFLALSPDKGFKTTLRNDSRISRQRIGFRPVCKGRAPLRSSQSYFNPTFRSMSTKISKTLDKQTTDVKNNCKNVPLLSNNHERTAKSAPASGGTSCLDPEEFDCIQCFADEVSRRHKQQQQQQQQQPEQQLQEPQQHNEKSKYRNNVIKINRVTFSARPRPKKTICSTKRVPKAVCNKALEIPQALYGGWGVRSKKQTLTEGALRNPRDFRTDLGLNAHFRTLRITPCGSEDYSKRCDYEQNPPPVPTPTPIRQIEIKMRQLDVKMPEGQSTQYRLQTVP